MADIQTSTVSEEGLVSTSQVGDFEVTIDAAGEEGPNPNALLVANYAACFLPASRAGAERTGHGDLGRIQIDADADLDDGDDLERIAFTLHVEADLDDAALDEVVAAAEDICHVHAALREELHAEITAHGDAF
jgi:organic hydroperoxide reductase OsmC/OhrA